MNNASFGTYYVEIGQLFDTQCVLEDFLVIDIKDFWLIDILTLSNYNWSLFEAKENQIDIYIPTFAWKLTKASSKQACFSLITYYLFACLVEYDLPYYCLFFTYIFRFLRNWLHFQETMKKIYTGIKSMVFLRVFLKNYGTVWKSSTLFSSLLFR